jgi:hypothetical protein
MASEHAFTKQTQLRWKTSPCKNTGAWHYRKTFADKKWRPLTKALIRSKKEVSNELERDFATMA